MQSIGRGLSASLIVWFYRREGLFKQTRSYANGVALLPSWQHLLGGCTAGLWEFFRWGLTSEVAYHLDNYTWQRKWSAHTHTHTPNQPLCLDRWRGRRESGREGRLVLIAVNQAVRWEDRRGRQIALNSDPLPGRRAANVSERELTTLRDGLNYNRLREREGGLRQSTREEIKEFRVMEARETKGSRCQY